jgi:hypothetical protein
MPELGGLGKALILFGGALTVIGALLLLAGRLPSLGGPFEWLGKLPGDILIKREHFTFYFPLTTGIIVSVLLSLLLYFISFLSKR